MVLFLSSHGSPSVRCCFGSFCCFLSAKTPMTPRSPLPSRAASYEDFAHPLVLKADFEFNIGCFLELRPCLLDFFVGICMVLDLKLASISCCCKLTLLSLTYPSFSDDRSPKPPIANASSPPSSSSHWAGSLSSPFFFAIGSLPTMHTWGVVGDGALVSVL